MCRMAKCIQISDAETTTNRQHEAACPDTGQVIQQPEDDREDETAKPAHEADKSAHRADILGVIDRYVLVDRRLCRGS
jgi:hypothetical protein